MTSRGSDFVAVPDNNFVLSTQRLQQVRQENSTIPILVHLNNNPQNGPSTESCVFIQDYTAQQRAAYQTSLAAGQSRDGYGYMYSVFFPLCPSRSSYNVLGDSGMLQTLSNLLAKFNSVPAGAGY